MKAATDKTTDRRFLTIEQVAEELNVGEPLVRDDFLLRGRMRTNGGSPVSRDIHQKRADEATDLKLTSYVYGFFSAASSVRDTLAGTVVGVGGLGIPIVRAYLGWLVKK